MVGVEVGTRRRRKAALVGTHSEFRLLLAGVMAEICRRTADVVYVALEVGELRKLRDLTDNALVTAARDHSALMKRQSAEVAAAEAATVVYDREPDLLDSGNAALRLIHGVVGADIRQLRHTVKLLGFKRHHRGIDDEVPSVMLLNDCLAPHGVMLPVLDAGRIGVQTLILPHLGVGGNAHALEGALRG